MLGRIRGKPKDDDEALEALRRRTAARLAAIVGISVDGQPEDDLGPDDADGAPEPGASFESGADDAAGEIDEPDEADGTGAAIALGAPEAMDEADAVGEADEPDELELEPAADHALVASGFIEEAWDDEAPTVEADATATLEAAPGDAVVVAADEAAVVADGFGPQDASTNTDEPLAASVELTESTPRASTSLVTLPERVVPVMAATTARPLTPVMRAPAPAKAPSPAAKPAAAAKPKARRRKGSTLLPAACPSCGVLLDELPTASRRCTACRQRIVVRRVEGRLVLVAEAVAPFFDDHRRGLVSGERIKREAGRWLQMAALAGAAPDVLEARARAVAARPKPEAVASARTLYATTVERAVRAARKAHDWKTVAELRFRQARAYHRAAGSAVPVDPAIAVLHAEAIDASLRRIRETAAEAELVGGTCCEACRAGTGQVVKIAAERRAPTVPHAECPAGLCGCRWDVPVKVRQAVAKPKRKEAAAAGAGRARA